MESVTVALVTSELLLGVGIWLVAFALTWPVGLAFVAVHLAAKKEVDVDIGAVGLFAQRAALSAILTAGLMLIRATL